jgi:transcriptional regulator with GAF, ATPase, and Fis domain
MTTMPDPIHSALPVVPFREPLAREVNKAILTSSVIEQILPTIASSLQETTPHDYAAIALRDEKTGLLRLRELTSGYSAVSPQETLLTIGGTPSGWVLTHQRSLSLSKIDHKQFSKPLEQLPADIAFGCWIPLMRRNQAIGVLFLGSRHDAVLEQRAIGLMALSSQIAGAIEITESFQQIVDFTDRLREEKSYLEEQVRSEWKFENVLGNSAGFAGVIEQVRRVAPGHQTVLIKGEIGTEKELIARLIHQLSPRNKQIFVKVNCAGYPPHILAKKLFGYEKESLRGGVSKRLGRLELADLGTLFLEEVGDLPIELQSRLLLALQRPENQGKAPHDVRLLASTSRDLAALVNVGKFNRELFQLLMTFPIQVLPLRKRASDIPLLVNHFVGKYAKQMSKMIDTIPRDTMAILCAGQWPGNLRELENFIERAVMLTPGSTLRAPLVELEAQHDENLQAAERQHILRILKETNGVIGGPGGAASRLGVKRTTLNSKLKKLGIEREAYR